MTSQTIKTSGETSVIEVSSWSYSLFTEKLADLNKKLVKWGLPEARKISRELRSHDLSTITGKHDDEGTIVFRWHMMVEVPVATAGIEGYTLIGKIEDLGNDQRMLSAIVSDTTGLPTCPVERDEHGEYKTREDENLGRDWFYQTYHPAYEALKAENTLKLESLRSVKQVCEHCKTTRRRKAVLVFEKTDGSLAQIGTGCADEYFGVELLRALSGTWDMIERCGGTPKSFNPAKFREDFALVLHIVTRYGYTSTKVEQSFRENAKFVPAGTALHLTTSTTNMVYEIRNHTNDGWSNLSVEEIAILAGKDTKAMADKAADLYAAAMALPSLSDERAAAHGHFLAYNSLMLLAMALVDEKRGPKSADEYAATFFLSYRTRTANYTQAYADAMNFWAGVVPAADDQFTANVKAIALAEADKSVAMTSMVALKWLEATREVEKHSYFVPAHRAAFPKEPADRFLGTKGEMVNLDVTITFKRWGGGDYSEPWYLLKGRTSDNVSVSWFCKRSLFEATKEGDVLSIRGKVKDHETYKDQKNTTLFYVKEA